MTRPAVAALRAEWERPGAFTEKADLVAFVEKLLAALEAPPPDIERATREGVTAARDLWVDGAEFDDAASMGIGVALGLAGVPGTDPAPDALTHLARENYKPIREGLQRAAMILCETRGHAGVRPCSFCHGQIVAPYSPGNLAARGVRGEAPPEPPPGLNETALAAAERAYWQDNGVSRHNLGVAILTYLGAVRAGALPPTQDEAPAPPRTERMDLHQELDQRFPQIDDFKAWVRGVVPAPPPDIESAYRKINRALAAFDWNVGPSGRPTGNAFVKQEDYDELLAGIDELRRGGRAVSAPQEGPPEPPKWA